MIARDLPRLLRPDDTATWARNLIDDLNVRLRALTRASVTSADSTYGYLNEKLVAGSNITLTVLNAGGNEQLQINSTGGGPSTHALLDSTVHTDTTTRSPTAGALLLGVAGAPATWDRLLVGGEGTYLRVTGGVPTWDVIADGDVPNTITLNNLTQITTRNYGDLQNRSHVLATNTTLGPDHTISGAAAGQVLRASSATAANFQTLAHSDLSGLTSGDPHTQYVAIAGRTGTSNDFLISTSGGVGTITGTNAGGGTFVLAGSSAAGSFSESINLTSLVKVFNDTARYPSTWSTTFNLVDIALTTFTVPAGSNPSIRAVNFQPTWTTDTGINQMVLFRSAPTFITTNASSTTFGLMQVFNGGTTITPGTGSDITGNAWVGMNANLTLNAAGAASTMPTVRGLSMAGAFNTDWTIDDWVAVRMAAPTGTSGAALRAGGMELNDLVAARITNTYTVWSKGDMPLLHQGPAVFGVAQATLTVPATSTMVDINGALAMRRADLSALASGNNNNLAIGNRSFIKTSSNAGGSTVTGFANGADGKFLILYNTANNITIAHENANSTNINRIRTNTGADLAASTGEAMYMFVYDSGNTIAGSGTGRWILLGALA